MSLLLLCTCLLPALLSVGVLRPHWYSRLLRGAPVLPAAVLLLGLTGAIRESYPVLALGLDWQLDELARRFLPFIALIWFAAGWQLRQRSPGRPFLACFLLCMSGSLTAPMAVNGVGFYVAFSVASIAAYGMVASGRNARGAAGLYLGLALLGEFLFLAGIILHEGGGSSVLVGWLIYFGLGAKLGVVPLHVSLPPAYRAAPTVGGVVLGGAVISLAIIGWLRFLPLAGDALPTLAAPMMALGVATALAAAAAGICQTSARALLGYSSVSQMGIVTAAVGLAAGQGWRAMVPALTVFAAHHGLVKAALLLGVGVIHGRRRRAVLLVLVLLSLALAGAPLTGGALAKGWIEELAGEAAGPWARGLYLLLPLTSVATLLLMARFLWLIGPVRQGGSGRQAPFFLLAVAALLAPWLYILLDHPRPLLLALGWSQLRHALWPTLAGLALAAAAVAAQRRGRLRWRGWLPPGDLAVWLAPGLRGLRERLLAPPPAPRWRLPPIPAAGRLLEAGERQLLRLGIAGVAYLLLVGGISYLLLAA